MGAVALLHLAALAALDARWPNLRDPEYGWRAARLRARIAEHPRRPVVVVIGSSRVAMGVKPDAWEAVRPGAPDDPMLFNLGAVGAGPIQQLVAARRLFADGFRPAAVLFEYWPLLNRQDGEFGEEGQTAARLRLGERALAGEYFARPEKAAATMRTARLHPLYANRARWAALAAPGQLSADRHDDRAWRALDRWGWLPGPDVRPGDAATRDRFLRLSRDGYRRRLDGHTIHPTADRAVRDAVALARAHGATVGLLYMPESAEFRGWYPADVEAAGRAHFASLAEELGAPAIDARGWMPDNLLADGHHLSRAGAGAFTARFGPAVARTFVPTGGGR